VKGSGLTPVLDVPGSEQIISAVIYYPNGGQQIAIREPYAAVPSTVDISAMLLPAPSGAKLVGNEIQWAELGAGTPDYVIAGVHTLNVATPFSRVVAAPYTGTSLAVPQLPAKYAKYNPRVADAPFVIQSLVKVTGGYDVARPRLFNGENTNVVPMNGRAVATYGR
jgi:hypothetical protein